MYGVMGPMAMATAVLSDCIRPGLLQGMHVCRRWLYVLGRSDALWRETDLEPHHKAVTDDVLVKLLKTCVVYLYTTLKVSHCID
jgi:hypothetical protein